MWGHGHGDHIAINTRQGNEQAGELHPGRPEGEESEDPHQHLFY